MLIFVYWIFKTFHAAESSSCPCLVSCSPHFCWTQWENVILLGKLKQHFMGKETDSPVWKQIRLKGRPVSCLSSQMKKYCSCLSPHKIRPWSTAKQRVLAHLVSSGFYGKGEEHFSQGCLLKSFVWRGTCLVRVCMVAIILAAWLAFMFPMHIAGKKNAPLPSNGVLRDE